VLLVFDNGIAAVRFCFHYGAIFNYALRCTWNVIAAVINGLTHALSALGSLDLYLLTYELDELSGDKTRFGGGNLTAAATRSFFNIAHVPRII